MHGATTFLYTISWRELHLAYRFIENDSAVVCKVHINHKIGPQLLEYAMKTL